jgi:hypothetical protein
METNRTKFEAAYAKWPKYDVFIAHTKKDEGLIAEIKTFFEDNNITYTTPEDARIAKQYVLTMIGPSPVRDSYFFLLIGTEENINDAEIQDWLWHAAQLNKSLISLKFSEEVQASEGNCFYYNEETKQATLIEIMHRLRTETRDPNWIFSKRRALV